MTGSCLRQVPGRGRGVVAARCLSEGELVAAESPLVCWCVRADGPLHVPACVCDALVCAVLLRASAARDFALQSTANGIVSMLSHSSLTPGGSAARRGSSRAPHCPACLAAAFRAPSELEGLVRCSSGAPLTDPRTCACGTVFCSSACFEASRAFRELLCECARTDLSPTCAGAGIDRRELRELKSDDLFQKSVRFRLFCIAAAIALQSWLANEGSHGADTGRGTRARDATGDAIELGLFADFHVPTEHVLPGPGPARHAFEARVLLSVGRLRDYLEAHVRAGQRKGEAGVCVAEGAGDEGLPAELLDFVSPAGYLRWSVGSVRGT